MGRDKDDSWLKHYDFILIDVLFVELSFLLAYWLKNKTFTMTEIYEVLFWVIFVVSLISGFMLDSYSKIIQRGYIQELKKVLKYCAFISIGLILGMFVLKTSEVYSRMIILIMYPISVVFVYISRLVWKRIVRNRIAQKKDNRNIFVISSINEMEEVLKGLDMPYKNYQVIGCSSYNDEDCIGKTINHIKIVANNRETILKFISDNVVDEIFINLPLDNDEARKMTDTFVNMGLVVNQKIAKYNFKDEHKNIQEFGSYIVMSSGMNFTTTRQLFFKRALDICGAIVGLILMGISYIIFAPIIKHQSPGPALFSQVRVGRNGRKFKIYKFRTMYMDAEERKKELMEKNKMNGFMFKMDNDPRIIPVGHFLRKSSIDELPQFWNILKGEMSLVGTRPPTVDEVAQYEIHHRKRLAMKPGLTGMWQVSGRSDITDFEEVVALDAKYICEWKLGLDIKILWKTVVQVLGGKGAV